MLNFKFHRLQYFIINIADVPSSKHELLSIQYGLCSVTLKMSQLNKKVRHCGLVVSASACDGSGCEFDSWQCRIYIPCSLSLRLLGSLRGSLGTYGLTQKLLLKKKII